MVQPPRMDHIGRARLVAQRIAAPLRGTVPELVAWMGAMQAQDYLGVRFALGVRLAARPDDAAIERSIARGELVRIHAMRFTWQLVTPADVRSILAVTAPRMRASIGRRHARLGLDERTLRRAGELLVERILAGDAPVARDDVAAELERAGVSVSGQRLAHILVDAEIAGLICNGARDGKRFTYTRLERLAPPRARRSIATRRSPGSPRSTSRAVARPRSTTSRGGPAFPSARRDAAPRPRATRSCARASTSERAVAPGRRAPSSARSSCRRSTSSSSRTAIGARRSIPPT